MARIAHLVSLLVFVIAVHTGHSARISSKGRKHVTQIGETKELPCTILGNDFNPLQHVVIWYKLEGTEQYQINTVTTTNALFRDTGRYAIKLNQTKQDDVSMTMFTLVLTNVTLSENGSFKCDLKHHEAIIASIEHTNIVPAPLDIFIFNSNVTRETNRSGTTFEFDELAASYIGCRAVGGNPIPTLRIFRDDLEITSEFDKHIDTSNQGNAGLKYVRHEVILYTINYRANRDQREQTLKCSAKFHRFQQLRENRQATIEVKYAPGFLCERHRAVLPGEDSFTIDCTLEANPAVDATSVTWLIGNTDMNLTSGQALMGYNATSRIDPATRHVKVFLTIQNVTNTSYQIYHLRARNDVGERSLEIQLFEATTTTETTTELPTTTPEPTMPKDQLLLEGGNAKPASATDSTTTQTLSAGLALVCLLAALH